MALALQPYREMSVGEWLGMGDSGTMTDAGIFVTPELAKRASAVFACIRILGGCVSTSPAQVFKRIGVEGRELFPSHPLYRKVHLEPNPMMCAATYFETMISHIYLYGNSISLLARNNRGGVQDIFLLDPRLVKIERLTDSGIYQIPYKGGSYRLDGRFRYQIPLEGGGYRAYDQDDILHIPNIFVDLSNNKGMATVEAGSQAIGLSLVAERHAASYLKNCMASDVVITYPQGKMSPDLRDETAKYIKKHYGGGQKGTPLVLVEGGTAATLTIDAAKAQILQSREFQVMDITRLFGIPPWLVSAMEKTTSWGAGIEQMNIGMVTYALNPLVVRVEQEYNRKIFRDGKNFVQFNITGLLRGDAKTRNEVYKGALGGNQVPGYMSQNAVRKLENLPPDDDPESDKIYRPSVDSGSVSDGQTTEAATEQ